MDYSCLLSNQPAQTIEIDQVQIKYQVIGSGSPLVMLPGTIGDQRIFCSIVEYLKEHFKVCVFDIISSADVHDIAIIYDKVIQQIIGAPVHLLGTSVGGWLAQYISERNPNQIKSLILSSTFCDNRILKENNGLIFTLSKYIPWFIFRRIFRKAVISSIPEYWKSEMNSTIFEKYVTNSLQNMGKSQLRDRFSLSLTDEASPVVEHSVPKLIIYARDDTTVPEESYKLIKNHYPEAEVVELAKGEHFPYIFNSGEYLEHIYKYLKTVDN